MRNTAAIFIKRQAQVPVETSLFSDDFTGTTINASKWAVVTPNASVVSVTQNEELDFNIKGTQVQAGLAGTNLYGSDVAIVGTPIGFTFDYRITAAGAAGLSVIGLTKESSVGGAQNYLIFGNMDSPTTILLISAVNGSETYIVVSPASSLTTQSFKVVIIGTDAIIQSWDDDSWVTLGNLAFTMWSGTIYPLIDILSKVSNSIDEHVYIDNFAVFDTDFATLRP